MNTSRGTSGTMVRLEATNASASEHTASTTASAAMTGTPKIKCAPTCSKTLGGTKTCNAAAAAAPTTKYAAACRKSWRATSQNTSHFDPDPGLCDSCGGSRRVIHSARPHRDHSQPITTAVSNDAPTLAMTIFG